MKVIFMVAAIAATFGFTIATTDFGNNEWKAPAVTDMITNPLKGNAAATAEGKKTFIQICAPCHGDKGKGDGIAGLALNPRPANYTSDKVQLQSDGALFWKITTGRPPMASYQDLLNETQRWQLVNYIRELGKNASKK